MELAVVFENRPAPLHRSVVVEHPVKAKLSGFIGAPAVCMAWIAAGRLNFGPTARNCGSWLAFGVNSGMVAFLGSPTASVCPS